MYKLSGLSELDLHVGGTAVLSSLEDVERRKKNDLSSEKLPVYACD